MNMATVSKGVAAKLASAAGTAALLAAISSVMVVSLNSQGYIVNRKSRFAVPLLQKMAGDKGIFDANHPVKSLIPAAIHSLVINHLGEWYVSAVQRLSEMDGTGRRGVIIRRLLFEALDAFLPIWWIAAVRRDKAMLVGEIQSIYMIDEVRRMATESVLPYILQAFNRYRSGRGVFADVADLVDRPEELDEWDDFNDWLEMVTQFGYLVSLGWVVPITFQWAFLSNYFEARSDVFHMCFCCRRPFPGAPADVATWRRTIEIIGYGGAAWNVVVASYAARRLLRKRSAT